MSHCEQTHRLGTQFVTDRQFQHWGRRRRRQSYSSVGVGIAACIAPSTRLCYALVPLKGRPLLPSHGCVCNDVAGSAASARRMSSSTARSGPSVSGDTVVEVSTATAPVGHQPAPKELPQLDHDEIRRYSRHLILPDVGMKGQRRLKASSVFAVGTGGLGSPALLYLAAAGVGRLGLVDDDVVDESNLQRQARSPR